MLMLEKALERIAPDVLSRAREFGRRGQLCGGTLEELGAFIRAVDHPQLGVCLDTAHSWAAGYDIDSPDGVDRFIALADETISLDRIKMFHFNDTQIPLGGNKDRHWHIGDGLIGMSGFRALAGPPRVARQNRDPRDAWRRSGRRSEHGSDPAHLRRSSHLSEPRAGRFAIVGADEKFHARLRTRFGLAPSPHTLEAPRGLAYCGREFRIYPSMRIGEAIRFYAALHERWDAARLDADLEAANLRPSSKFAV